MFHDYDVCPECLWSPELLDSHDPVDYDLYEDDERLEPFLYGVELEYPGEIPCDDLEKAELEKKGYVFKFDESVLPGFEMISSPASYAYHRDVLSYNDNDRYGILQANPDYIEGIDASCGMHVHASIIDKTYSKSKVAAKVKAFMYNNWDYLKNVFGRNNYAYMWYAGIHFWKAQLNDYEQMNPDRKPVEWKRFEEIEKYQTAQKREAVRTTDKTIEFRVFNVPQDRSEYMTNLHIVKTIMEICTFFDDDADIYMNDLALKVFKEEMDAFYDSNMYDSWA